MKTRVAILSVLMTTACPKRPSAEVRWDVAAKETMVHASLRAVQCGLVEKSDHEYLVNATSEYELTLVGLLPVRCESIPQQVIDRCAAWAKTAPCETFTASVVESPCSRLCEQ